MKSTGFTSKVIEWIRTNGPKSIDQISCTFGYLTKANPNSNLRKVEDLKFMGSTRVGVYYFLDQEEQAKKEYERCCRERDMKKEMRRKAKEQPLFNPMVKSCIDIFVGNEDYTIDEIWKFAGGPRYEFNRNLKALLNAHLLLPVKRNGETRYRMNPEYAKISNIEYSKAKREPLQPAAL